MVVALGSISALLLSVMLLQIGGGQFGTFLGLRMALEQFSPLAIGVVGSAYYAGFLLGPALGRRLVERVGHIRVFAALASILSASVLLHALYVHPWLWAPLRLVGGFCAAGLFVIAESWINERATNQVRGQIFAIYMIANYAALGAGQFLVGASDPVGLAPFLIGSFLFSIALVPVALTRAPSPAPVTPRRFGFAKLLRISPLGVVGCLCTGLTNSAFYALAPYYAERAGLGAAQVAQFMGLTILAGLVLQWPLGRLSDFLDRRSILIAIVAGGVAVSLGFVALDGRAGWQMQALGCAFGGLIFVVYSLAVAHANDFIEAEDLVPASAGLMVAYGIGAAAGPVLASGVMQLTGSPSGLFVYTAGVGVLVVLFGLYRMTRRRAPALEAQGAYYPVPRTSPVMSELDPRTEEPTARDEPAPAAVPSAGEAKA